jgi:hypothetical protein
MGIPNVIVSVPAVAFVARIASRSEMRPSAPGLAMRFETEVVVPSALSAVVVTTRRPTAWTLPANSDVLSEGSVAVADTYSPAVSAAARVTPNSAFPEAFVVTSAKPR